MKSQKVIVGLASILLLSGCATYQKINTADSRELSNELKDQFDDIKKIKLQMHRHGGIEWNITWRNPPSEEESFEVFHLIRDYINSEDFEQNILEDTFIEAYQSDTLRDPDVRINFDMNNDKKFDRQFTSFYNELTKYRIWYYSEDYISNGVLIENN
ncbi:hypothetical protein DCE79_11475 [Lysinibacillus sp. 2017]|uniref:hypothetical protein n=1 Tax=unclassified Lysinibacillus TaxID=2636778 RepID=UPI000D5293BF|nr:MULTISPECIES: hypothetical protein [unclassified Lysinibacillus]AWE07971.1 hypothetical protein DCE79_11475 [Lysinibacillus sp. 2017]TGN34837.1 hypothetical protein E4L99_12435 [Lysinibacillus sp. S2017]